MVQLSFGLWWEGLSTFAQVYWMIAIPSSVIFIVQLVLSFKGHKIELAQENLSGSQQDIKIPFQVVNFKNIIGFFTFFAWSGLACLDSGATHTTTIIISIACGLVMMLAMAIIVYFMGKLMKTVSEDL